MCWITSMLRKALSCIHNSSGVQLIYEDFFFRPSWQSRRVSLCLIYLIKSNNFGSRISRDIIFSWWSQKKRHLCIYNVAWFADCHSNVSSFSPCVWVRKFWYLKKCLCSRTRSSGKGPNKVLSCENGGDRFEAGVRWKWDGSAQSRDDCLGSAEHCAACCVQECAGFTYKDNECKVYGANVGSSVSSSKKMSLRR